MVCFYMLSHVSFRSLRRLSSTSVVQKKFCNYFWKEDVIFHNSAELLAALAMTTASRAIIETLQYGYKTLYPSNTRLQEVNNLFPNSRCLLLFSSFHIPGGHDILMHATSTHIENIHTLNTCDGSYKFIHPASKHFTRIQTMNQS